MPTRIEWATEVWNPITGCSPVSEGCQNCYAHKMAQRLKGRFGYPKDEPFKVTFHPDRLDQPLKWKKPRAIFVCSMGDLFHEDISYKQIARIFFEALRNINNHTYLFLTKRPKRMADFIKWYADNRVHMGSSNFLFEFPHIRLGVSVESDKYRWRIEELIKIPAAHRFISYEPALGALDLSGDYDPIGGLRTWLDMLDLVIAGGESGPGARPMHPDWVRSVRDQCVQAGVPFFFKQWGEWLPGDPRAWDESEKPTYWRYQDNSYGGFHRNARHYHRWADGVSSVCVGKKKAGRLLDGRQWAEMP